MLFLLTNRTRAGLSAAQFAARQFGRVGVGRQMDGIEHTFDPMIGRAVPPGDGRRDEIEYRGIGTEIRLLGQIGDTDTRLHDPFAVIGFPFAGQHLQQRRLAGAVAADQAQAIAGGDGKVDAGKQHFLPQIEGNVA